MENEKVIKNEDTVADDGIVIDTAETDSKRIDMQNGVEQEPIQEESKPDEVKEETVKEDTQPKKPTRAERRIQRQSQRIRELEEQLSKQESKPDEVKEEVKKVDEVNIDDFEDYDDYVKALDDQEKKADDKKSEKKEVVEKTLALDENKINDMLEDGAEDYENFEELLQAEDLMLTQDVLNNVLSSDSPSDIAYYLATHKDETSSIAKMTPKQMQKALLKIEIKLETKPNKVVRTTKAPAPITPVNGTSAASKSLNDDSLSFEEHEALLNATRSNNAGGFL